MKIFKGKNKAYDKTYTLRYLEAPEYYSPKRNEKVIFIAGGISNCPNWQDEVFERFKSEVNWLWDDILLCNPRRENFDTSDENATNEQIIWEHYYLKLAHTVLFWFPKETLCPITLFEYGKMLMTNKLLFVGCHPDYQRLVDLEVQTRLEKPQLEVKKSLVYVINNVINSLAHYPLY